MDCDPIVLHYHPTLWSGEPYVHCNLQVLNYLRLTMPFSLTLVTCSSRPTLIPPSRPIYLMATLPTRPFFLMLLLNFFRAAYASIPGTLRRRYLYGFVDDMMDLESVVIVMDLESVVIRPCDAWLEYP